MTDGYEIIDPSLIGIGNRGNSNMRAKARSTVELQNLVNMVNEFNLTSTGSDGVIRRDTLNGFLKVLLHEANAYKGFRYYEPDEVPEGEQPGLKYKEPSNEPMSTQLKNYDVVDATRIKFNPIK